MRCQVKGQAGIVKQRLDASVFATHDESDRCYSALISLNMLQLEWI